MKIVHLCLSNFYADNFGYQENELVAQNVRDGHQVIVIASTETFDANMKSVCIKGGEYLGSDGAQVIRVEYSRWLPRKIMRKLRMHKNIVGLLDSINPDVIFFHGACGWELKTAAEFKERNPAIKLYVDCHEDFTNSAQTFISKWVLHFCYYKPILHYSIKSIDKILCVNLGAIDFMRYFYRVPVNMLEFYPLGGRLIDSSTYSELRKKTRSEYGVGNSDLVFFQSGKFDKTKKLIESLKAFSEQRFDNSVYLVAGKIYDEIADDFNIQLRSDSRIRFLGWQSTDNLRALLCAADIYVQPGLQSATMQMSLCCRCVVILADVPSHQPYLDNNGWLVGENTTLSEAFQRAEICRNNLAAMSESSARIAEKLIDYKKLAARIY
jgi:hypothetical protein